MEIFETHPIGLLILDSAISFLIFIKKIIPGSFSIDFHKKFTKFSLLQKRSEEHRKKIAIFLINYLKKLLAGFLLICFLFYSSF